MKKCTRCDLERPISDFPPSPKRKGGVHPWCRDCKRSYDKEYRLKDPKRRYGNMIKQRYGITYEEYEEMLEQQNFVCVVCGRSNEQYDSVKKDTRRLHVDHDHATGRVRGLLCSKCNFALGCVRDDVDILNKLVEYLEGSNVE